MKANTVDKNSRQYLESKKAGARYSLLLMLIFTVVNLVLLLAESDRYFLFSASVPYYLTAFGMGMDLGIGNSVFTTTALVISALVLAAYLVCWLLSKKHPLCYIIALVLFALDTVLLVLLSISLDILAGNIMDLVFHGWVILELVQAILAVRKLRAMDREEAQGPVSASAAPQPSADFWDIPVD